MLKRWQGKIEMVGRQDGHRPEQDGAERFIYHVEDAFFEFNMCAGMQVVGAPSCAEIHCDSK